MRKLLRWVTGSKEFQRASPYPRLVKRNHGRSFNLKRKRRPLKRYADIYHVALSLSWWQLFFFACLFRLLVHMVFAALYYADNGGINTGTPYSADYFDCFFLSVQTMDTIGYGRLNPGSNYTSIIVCIQSYFGVFFAAASAGLVVAKMSRPSRQRKSILWSDHALVNNHERYWEGSCDAVQDGKYQDDGATPSLVFRLANMRTAQICCPTFALLLIRREYADQVETTDVLQDLHDEDDGHSSTEEDRVMELSRRGKKLVRRVHELNFEINSQVGRIRANDTSSPLLPLCWTITHAMDKNSPLYMASKESMINSQVEIIGIIDGLYEDSGNQFQARCSYTATDIVWDAKFVDCWYVNKKGRYVLDYGKIDDFKPVGRMGGGGIDDDNEDEEDTEV